LESHATASAAPTRIINSAPRARKAVRSATTDWRRKRARCGPRRGTCETRDVDACSGPAQSARVERVSGDDVHEHEHV